MKQLFFIICLFTFSTSHIIDAMENSDQEILVIRNKPGKKHPVFLEKENQKSPGKKSKEIPIINAEVSGKRRLFDNQEQNDNESPTKKSKSNYEEYADLLSNLPQIIKESDGIDSVAQILTHIKSVREMQEIDLFINDIKRISLSYIKNGTLPTKIQHLLSNNYPNLNINNVIITVENKNNRQKMCLTDFITTIRGFTTFKYLYEHRGANISENTLRLATQSKRIAEFLKINGHEIEIPNSKTKPINMSTKQFTKLNSKLNYSAKDYRIV